MELLFVLLFRYLRKLRSNHLEKVTATAVGKALPIVAK
jgi:hypothetical protein